MKKKITVLICSLLLIAGITFFGGLFKSIENDVLRRLVNIALNWSNGAIAMLATKCTGIKIALDFKNCKQYLIGAAIALVLSLALAVIPALCGVSLVGSHTQMPVYEIIGNFFYYIFVIGAVEELIFRVYLQETFTSFFHKHKWAGVVIAAAIFGLWHWVNGSFSQVLFTFGIGLVFGFAKHRIKDYNYLGLTLSHGLYNFLNTVVRLFIV